MRFDEKTAKRIANASITLLIQPGKVSVGRHTVAYERPRTWEDPKHAKGLETIQEAVCRIRVTEAELRPVGSVTYREGKRAGYANLDLFRAAFDVPNVWVAEFELVRDDDPVRLLAKGGGYTTTPALAIDELEAVSAATQREQTKEAHTFDDLRAKKRRETWARESTLQRYAMLVADARNRHIDISAHERVIEDRVERIAKLLGKDRAA